MNKIYCYNVDDDGFIIAINDTIETNNRIETECPYPIKYSQWLFSNQEWKINNKLVADDIIMNIKDIAYSVITDNNAFPEWRQQNFQSDLNYALYALSTARNISTKDVMNMCISKVGLESDPVNLKNIWKNIGLTIDLSELVDSNNTILPEEIQITYLKYVIKSILVYRLIRSVRKWSNDKENIIKNMIENKLYDESVYNELLNLDLEDYPDINVYE